jgi:muconolactone delta-isomerase
MKILALEKELSGAESEDFNGFAQAEAARAWELHQAGFIRELYFRADRHTAVLVLESEDVESAREALASLPLVANGLIEFELIPLRAYSGFERLFSGLST